MITSNDGSLVILPPAASATNATQAFSFDTTGFDYCNLYVLSGTANTQTAALTGLQVCESDTITSASSMTAIVELTCSAATSTSVANALPAIATLGLGGVPVAFQIDLRKRKKYMGLLINAATTQTAVLGAIAILSRGGQSSDTAAQKSLPLNLASTAVVGAMSVVTA